MGFRFDLGEERARRCAAFKIFEKSPPMKFGSGMLRYQVPEWRGYYFDFNLGKKKLKQCLDEIKRRQRERGLEGPPPSMSVSERLGLGASAAPLLGGGAGGGAPVAKDPGGDEERTERSTQQVLVVQTKSGGSDEPAGGSDPPAGSSDPRPLPAGDLHYDAVADVGTSSTSRGTTSTKKLKKKSKKIKKLKKRKDDDSSSEDEGEVDYEDLPDGELEVVMQPFYAFFLDEMHKVEGFYLAKTANAMAQLDELEKFCVASERAEVEQAADLGGDPGPRPLNGNGGAAGGGGGSAASLPPRRTSGTSSGMGSDDMQSSEGRGLGRSGKQLSRAFSGRSSEGPLSSADEGLAVDDEKGRGGHCDRVLSGIFALSKNLEQFCKLNYQVC